VFRLVALARQVRADVVHTNGMKAHLIGGLAGKVARVPVVWHLRDFPPASRMFRRAARQLPRLILAVSEAVARTVLPEHEGVPRVVTLHDPVDTRRFHPDLRKERIRDELGVGAEVPVVGLIAHLTPWKGHELFLDIARVVVNRGDVRFVVVGGAIYKTEGHADYVERLRRRVKELGLTDRVAFMGFREDMPDILAGLDVLVHCPTAPEPFGRVLAEAMAVGRPVVAARCGGIPEVVDDGVTGYLVKPGDVSAFASTVTRLLADRTLRERLGQAGRRRAEERFTVADHVTAVVEAYRALLISPTLTPRVMARA
jgi:glycosyltransferase involved in cell wall biosynthesis